MIKLIDAFIDDMHKKKNSSKNTEMSYRSDLMHMVDFLCGKSIKSVKDVNEDILMEFVNSLFDLGRAKTTISRTIASMKAFFEYLFENGIVDTNPASNLKSPKIEKKVPEILTIDEIDQLLKAPSKKTPKELRDKAMLELMYATGLRVSELISLNVNDINWQTNEIHCASRKSDRVIPFGTEARKALHSYLKNGRPILIADSIDDIDSLFTNCSGQPMSRQGFWKLIKHYSDKAGIEKEITPHTLRHSFAAHLVENGADISSVKDMLGHSDISTTQVYVNMANKKMHEIYAKAHPRN